MDLEKRLRRTGNYSPLRYPGGKALLSPFIGDILKQQGLHKGTYVEPYAGGAGAALSLLLSEQVSRIVINDFDPAIYAFWNSVVNYTDAIVERIQKASIDVDEWRRQRQLYKNPGEASQTDLGFAAFFLNRVNRSGIIEGWPIGGLKQEGKWKIDVRFNRQSLIERIRRIGLYKDRIEVLNIDAMTLIKNQIHSPSTFTYLDPPYYEKGGSLYLNHYRDSDHVALAEFLNSNSNANWILTYDNLQKIRNLYPARSMQEFGLRYSASKKTIGSEIMIFSNTVASALGLHAGELQQA